jgi:hypothetical protein
MTAAHLGEAGSLTFRGQPRTGWVSGATAWRGSGFSPLNGPVAAVHSFGRSRISETLAERQGRPYYTSGAIGSNSTIGSPGCGSVSEP